jgi:hypothetical protein
VSALTDTLLLANYRALRSLTAALDRNTVAVLEAAEEEDRMAQEFDQDVQALDAVVQQVVSVGAQLSADVQAVLDKLSSAPSIDAADRAEIEAAVAALQGHAATLQGLDTAAQAANPSAPEPPPA